MGYGYDVKRIEKRLDGVWITSEIYRVTNGLVICEITRINYARVGASGRFPM